MRFAENKEPRHATYIPYASEKEMTEDAEYYHTPWTKIHSSTYLSLNGHWNKPSTISSHKGGNPKVKFHKDEPINSKLIPLFILLRTLI